MSGTGDFAEIIKAVTDIWGLLALALLLIGVLAIQLTKGANPNLRLATFLVIFAGFLASLYMAFANQPEEQRESAAVATASPDIAKPPDAKEIEAQASNAAEYRESVDKAYGNAADQMDEVARMIAGEEPSPTPSPTAD